MNDLVTLSLVPQSKAPLTRIVMKLASRCNLNCSYCYVYNKGDSSWRVRPPVMPAHVVLQSVLRIREHCESYQLKEIRISFHGGEPCLFGVVNFERLLTDLRSSLAGISTPRFYLQTNGVLIDDEWCRVLRMHEVAVGVSLDGPPEINDKFRVTKKNKGSYSQVVKSIEKLVSAGVRTELLCVMQLGADGGEIQRHMSKLGVSAVTYLLPDFTHDTIDPIRAVFGHSPVAKFVIGVFQEWLIQGWDQMKVGDLWNIIRILNGAPSKLETFGTSPPLYVFVETDGSIEGLDCLRVCADSFAATGLNIFQNDLQSISQLTAPQFQAIFERPSLAQDCKGCSERMTCAGGYLPHRYSSSNGFDNPSIWCEDIKLIFSYIRQELGINERLSV